MMFTTIRWCALLALVALTLVLGPTSVGAHADYVRSEPAPNVVLAEPPARVDVWFTQEIFKREGANFVRVFDEQEVQVSEGNGTVDDDDRTHMFAELQSGLPAGRYIVRWMTTSDEDGDTDDGAFCFYAGVEPTAEQEVECTAFGEPEATPTTAAPTLTAGQPKPRPPRRAAMTTVVRRRRRSSVASSEGLWWLASSLAAPSSGCGAGRSRACALADRFGSLSLSSPLRWR